ncbi:MAG TPA: HAMP domain-containing sensor histidine kinase [Amycolatopsis sp.]|nr:HAMP domain-containing sensor histidine kinase [Amycolatopsis sp.]
MSRGLGLTIRVRLTLLYGSLMLGTSTVLLGFVIACMWYWPHYEFATPVPASLAQPAIPGTGPPNPATIMPVTAVVGVTRPTISSLSSLHSSLLWICGTALLVCTVIGLGLGWVAATQALAPMRRITRTAAGIACNNLHARVNLTGPQDEVRELADTFDAMLVRLEATFEAQQQFAANASHELLSPIAASRMLLDMALAHPDACDVSVLAEKLMTVNKTSARIVEGLLMLARADHGPVQYVPVNLLSIVNDSLNRIGVEAEAARIRVHLASTGSMDAEIRADENLLRPLVDNLLRNAVRHNHHGGTVSVAVASDNVDSVTLTVANTGPQVPQDKADRLFEPFFRVEGRSRHDERAGHGLGMAIIRAIVRAHDGAVTARPNPGGGLTVSAALPARRTAAVSRLSRSGSR